MNHDLNDLIPSEYEPEWPPSEADIQAMFEAGEIDDYDREKALDALIAQELWRESLPCSVPSFCDLNPNLK
ncbi:hypothetical protein [uncultured Mediterranean phage uvMED]|nr:hypothetical protein [uncultured Mediterranean phage uvMED]BAQ93311.1 hypothetical protein [uncultured Mediterranean phage uvMED]BAQ93389.1 hypothetical protein [uncultured Mediterranean phage uvMED]BAR24635.1 hypothetical protein [uncultured Mediterranean phage uvMED]